MKSKILILFCLFSIKRYCTIYHSIKDGNFDNANTWFENQVPTFNGDTIYINHAVYMKRNNDTINYVRTWYDLLNRIIVEREGVLCLRNVNYVIYSVFFDIKGQLYANQTTFMFSGCDVTGYVSCDEVSIWREVWGATIHGYGFNIGVYEVDFIVKNSINEANQIKTTEIIFNLLSKKYE